jgi:hypothetical protein
MTEKIILDKIKKYFPDYLIAEAPRFKYFRFDFFGVFDLMLINLNGFIHFIQATTLSNISARRKKILANIPLQFHIYWQIWGYDERKDRFKIINESGIIQYK